MFHKGHKQIGECFLQWHTKTKATTFFVHTLPCSSGPPPPSVAKCWAMRLKCRDTHRTANSSPTHPSRFLDGSWPRIARNWPGTRDTGTISHPLGQALQIHVRMPQQKGRNRNGIILIAPVRRVARLGRTQYITARIRLEALVRATKTPPLLLLLLALVRATKTPPLLLLLLLLLAVC